MDASIWEQILTRIETKVNRHSFYTWFKPTSFVADGGSSITVRVPNALFKDWLTKHYSVVLSEALAEVRRSGAALVFVAIGPAVLAYRCWATGVQRVGPNVAGFFANLTPLFAALLSAAFLGELPQVYHALAFGLIVGGIVVSSRR